MFRFIAFLFASILYADPAGDAWVAQIMAANRLRDMNRPAEAEAAYKAALIQSESEDSDPLRAGVILSNHAFLLHRTGRLLEAEKHYLRALSLIAKSAGPRHRAVIRTAANLVGVYLDTGQTSRAALLIRRFLPERETVDDPDMALLLTSLASVLAREHKYEEAEGLLLQAQSVFEKQPDAAYRESLALTAGDLASIRARMGRRHEAGMLFSKALELLAAVQNPFPPALIGILNENAKLFMATGDLARAESLFKQAIDLGEQSLGAEHPILGAVLSEYAVLLRRAGRRSQAGGLEKKAGEILAAFRHQNHIGHTVEAGSLAKSTSR